MNHDTNNRLANLEGLTVEQAEAFAELLDDLHSDTMGFREARAMLVSVLTVNLAQRRIVLDGHPVMAERVLMQTVLDELKDDCPVWVKMLLKLFFIEEISDDNAMAIAREVESYALENSIDNKNLTLAEKRQDVTAETGREAKHSYPNEGDHPIPRRHGGN